MSNDITLDIRGQKELFAKLSALKRGSFTKVVRAGLKAGANIAKEIIKANTPVDTGALKKAVKVRAGKRRQKGRITYLVSTSGKANLHTGSVFYGGFVEFGYHLGKRSNATRQLRKSLYKAQKKAGLTGNIDQRIVHASDKRTFIEGQHFMRRGFESSVKASEAAIIETMRSKISELAK